ncbi:MAG: peptidylprolyl isomerase [Candidatus Niameybacter stercoravium]|nr:peptidylprolyl isomerase [Candidatus Niameybacter stercoravium]
MKGIKKLLALALTGAVLMTSITGCAFGNGKTSKAVVAVINGEKIPESLYRIYLWYTQQYFEQISGPGIWDMEIEGQKTGDLAKQRALESNILSVVANKKAEDLGIKISKEDKRAAKENAESFVKSNPEIIEIYGFNEEDIEQFLISTDIVSLVEEKLGENYMPQEEEIQKYINENKSAYEEVTAKHVLIKTTDENLNELPKEEQEAKRKLATEVLDKALAGEDMSELARTYSEDQGSLNQVTGVADGEYTFKRGKMVKEFEDAAFNGEDGKVWPELVKTAYGYHIIKTEKHIPANEEVMRDEFIAAARREFTNNEFNTMISNATVEKTELYDTISIIRESDIAEEVPETNTTTNE